MVTAALAHRIARTMARVVRRNAQESRDYDPVLRRLDACARIRALVPAGNAPSRALAGRTQETITVEEPRPSEIAENP
jgi:hypothetical protein